MVDSVVEYTIITNDDPSQVVKEVNLLLSNGWELYGELKVTTTAANYGSGTTDEEVRIIYSYSQAMVFREPDEAAGA